MTKLIMTTLMCFLLMSVSSLAESGSKETALPLLIPKLSVQLWSVKEEVKAEETKQPVVEEVKAEQKEEVKEVIDVTSL